MNKLRNKLGKYIKDFNPYTLNNYDYKHGLNWRDDGNDSDDGQGVEDPSMNDFLMGYNIDPYEFRQWATKKKKLAAREVDLMQFTPEYLADKILRLWNGADGTLQDFFEAFTLRYKNDLKIKIAVLLEKRGYKVYPVLTEDRPIYARHNNILKKIKASNNIENIIKYCRTIFAESDVINELADEIDELNKSNLDLEPIDLSGIIDYYMLIYPEEYALSLVNKAIKDESISPQNQNVNKANSDFGISNESLEKIEDYMSGNSDPTYNKDYGFGDFAYDNVSDTRSDTLMPREYMIQVSKKKLIRKADEISNIPLYMVIDAISQAARNVSILLNRSLQSPPTPIKSIRKQSDSNVDKIDNYKIIEPINTVSAYEIWKVNLENDKNSDELDHVYVIIKGDYTLQGYKNGKWSNIKYMGFYTTVEEAQYHINGYIR